MIHPDTLSLPDIETDIWNLLTAGSKNPKEAFYTGTRGTQSPRGVKLRTVVIREVNAQENKSFAIDKRAGKVAKSNCMLLLTGFLGCRQADSAPDVGHSSTQINMRWQKNTGSRLHQ
jgi:hypothetical protein